MSTLELLADLAAVATAVVAVSAFVIYQVRRGRRRARLEAYLKEVAESGSGQGLRSSTHLMARLRMTEADILQASFGSDRITCKVAVDQETGLANQLLFGYQSLARAK